MSARRLPRRPTVSQAVSQEEGLWACFSAQQVSECLRRGEHTERPDPHGGPEGQTPLHRACRSGLSAVAEALLRGGAQPNASDVHGECPLHALLAPANLTNPSIQKHILMGLLRHGANPRLADQDGNTALHLAAMKGNLDFCERLLAAGATLTDRNIEGQTPADLLLVTMPRLAQTSPWRERLFEMDLQQSLPTTAGPARRAG